MGAVCAKPIATIKSWAKRKKQKNHITGGQQPRYGNEHDLIQPQQPYQSDNSLHKSSKFSKVPAVLGGLMAAKKHGSRGHGGGHQQQYDEQQQDGSESGSQSSRSESESGSGSGDYQDADDGGYDEGGYDDGGEF